MEKGDTLSRAQKIRSLELAGVVILFTVLLLFLAGGHHPAAAAERESGKWYGVDATWGDEGKTASLRWFMYGQNEVNNKEHPGDSDYMFGDESYDFAIPALEPLGIGYSRK
ncbi:MAG: hypothetical protein II640_09205 [Lachnospiraceae bacterium]|nr:hypothetical protein [Lachnospiraceae bacterium]